MTEAGHQSANVAGTNAVFELADIVVQFGGLRAVDGVSIALLRGTICGLIGPNGSGKSTLLAAATGLVDYSGGFVSLDGVKVKHVTPVRMARLGVARTFQTTRLLDELTVLENVRVAADRVCKGLHSKSAGNSLAADALSRVGLKGYEKLRPRELSYGTQRRVEIARAIAMNPRVLLLDEPTAGMNRQERMEVSSVLTRLRDDGMTQLLVEHDAQMMADTCDRLIAMNAGAVIAAGDPQVVLADGGVREAYLGKGRVGDA